MWAALARERVDEVLACLDRFPAGTVGHGPGVPAAGRGLAVGPAGPPACQAGPAMVRRLRVPPLAARAPSPVGDAEVPTHPGPLELPVLPPGWGSTLQVVHREFVCTDASLSGWGAVHRGMPARGCWEPPWTGQHITVLVLRALFLALQAFTPGGLACPRRVGQLGGVVLHLPPGWREVPSPAPAGAGPLGVGARPSGLAESGLHPRVLTTAAGVLSRVGPKEEEWRLHPQVVQCLWGRFGMAQVGLFAFREPLSPLLLPVGPPRDCGDGCSGP